MAGNFETAHVVADTYAEALLAAAQQQDQADELAWEFAELIRYVRDDKTFTRFLESAVVDEDQRRESLRRIFGHERLSRLLTNFLLVLNDRGRLPLLSAIYESYRRQLDVLRGRQEVHVTTAVPLTAKQRRQVQQAISMSIEREAILVERVEPGLLGGLVLEMANRRMDASIRHRLDELAEHIRRSGMREVQAGRRPLAETSKS